MAGNVLELSNVRKGFKGGVIAIGDLSLSVEEGEFVTIVGPSGCGKTTLLRCISGLEPVSGGEIRFRGVSVTEPPEGLGFVFQEYGRSLLPWMTVLENIMLPLRAKKVDKKRRLAIANEALSAVRLSEFGHASPWQLSGGMQQRVALARALAYGPELLLMDEPFASVDAQTRQRLEDLVLDVRNRFHLAVLLVTHDVDEAVYLGDRVVIISQRPAEVQCTVAVDLPPDRDQVVTKELRRFAELRTFVARRIESGAATHSDRAGSLAP